MKSEKRVVVLGCGPTGLGAAIRLHELGHSDWDVYDMAHDVGGLSSSYTDEKGFTFDLGGHVIHSHYQYFDDVVTTAIPQEEWIVHIRESWCWVKDRFIPYPFQLNFHRLPKEVVEECIDGLLEVHNSVRTSKNFEELILNCFGKGIAKHFMIPYNLKVWGFPAKEMDCGWIRDRVATVDLKKVIMNGLFHKDDTGWGPNAIFKFPLKGGTGSIWKRVKNLLPAERIHLKKEVSKINVTSRTIEFTDGTVTHYDVLMTSCSLVNTAASICGVPSDVSKQLVDLASKLCYSSTHVVGLGFEGKLPDHLAHKSWIYFSEDTTPFYRATVFSRYSPFNVPDPEKYWSFLLEVSQVGKDDVSSESIADQCLKACKAIGLVPADAVEATRWHRKLELGYPTPTISRDETLKKLQTMLREWNIWSRGRFGGWKYEVSNQDHSLMQGVEAVDNALFGTEEITYNFPDIVNREKSTRRYTLRKTP